MVSFSEPVSACFSLAPAEVTFFFSKKMGFLKKIIALATFVLVLEKHSFRARRQHYFHYFMMFQQKEEAYIPMGPAESARIRAAAEGKLSELFQSSKLLQEKSAFLAWTNSITNDLIGVGSKKQGNKNNSPTNNQGQHSPSSSSSSSSSGMVSHAIPEMTDDMKYPSFLSLDKLRALRENVSNVMGIEGNEDANIPYEPYLDARRKHHQAQQQAQFQSDYRPSVPMEGESSFMQRKERAVSFDERTIKAEDNVGEEEEEEEEEDDEPEDEDAAEDDEDEEAIEIEDDRDEKIGDENMHSLSLDPSTSTHQLPATSPETEAMTAAATYNARYRAEMTAAYKGSDMDASKALTPKGSPSFPIDTSTDTEPQPPTPLTREASMTTNMSTTFEPQSTTTQTTAASAPRLGTQSGE